MCRVKFLDGLRGWASFSVLLSHLWVCLLMWNFPEYALSDELGVSLLEKENYFGMVFFIFFRFATDGHLAVFVFFVLSGYVLTASYSASNVLSELIGLIFGRYLRLTIFALVVNLLIYTGMRIEVISKITELHYSSEAIEWISKFYNFEPSLLGVLKFTIYDMYFNYTVASTYNASLWTMRYEFFGSALLYIYMHITMGNIHKVWDIFLAAILLFKMPIIACFHVGSLLYRVDLRKCDIWLRRVLGSQILEYIAIAALIFVGGFSSMYRLNDQVVALYAILIVLFVLLSKYVQRWLESSVSQLLGEISFPLYLVQMPIIFIFTINIINGFGFLGIFPNLKVFLNFSISVSVAILFASVIRPIEIFCIRMSKISSNLVVEWFRGFNSRD